MASDTASQILSGWPSVTDSDVKINLSIVSPFNNSWLIFSDKDIISPEKESCSAGFTACGGRSGDIYISAAVRFLGEFFI